MSDIPGTIVTTHDELRALHPHTYLVIHPLASAVASPWSAEDLMRWHDDQDMDIKVIPAVVMIDGYEYDAHRDALLNSDAYRSPLMPEQTPVTDDDRSAAYEWAASLDPDMRCWTDRERAAARVILATVDAPTPTLSERLQYRATLLDNGDPDGDTPQALRDLATLAAQMEQDAEDRQEWNRNITKQVATLARERDEAHADVERLTTERDGAREEIAWLRNGPGHTEVATDLPDPAERHTERPDDDWLDGMKESTRYAINATRPDPADVPEGEAWTIKTPDGEARAFKTTAGWVYEQNGGYVEVRGDAANVILVARLVPDTRRVIDRPEDLDKFPEGSIAIDKHGEPWRHRQMDWVGEHYRRDDENLLEVEGPITVIYVPEVTA